ncbi:MAG: hypothetical protein Q9204_003593 [Flavoplaca sp. TL-2023a]
MSSASRPQPSWLLLLPSPPLEVTLSDIRSRHGSTISQVLQKAAGISSSFSTVTILDVAVSTNLGNVGNDSKSFCYSALQTILGQLYSLICLLCAENCIDVQYGNDVDVRILLLRKVAVDGPPEDTVQAVEDHHSVGPIVSLRRLACCGRPWQRVCSTDDEDGEIQLQLFLKLRNEALDESKGKIVIERLPSNSSHPASSTDTTASAAGDQATRVRHDAVAVGGTFDHLHVGHKLLLSMTALVINPNVQSDVNVERSLIVGITGDKLLENKKFSEHLQDWYQRQAAVQSFLLAFLVVNEPLQNLPSTMKEKQDDTLGHIVKNNLPSGLTIEYVEIFDAFGPTITNESISALVLSRETRAGGEAVNSKRAEKQWASLDIFEVDVLDSAEADRENSNHPAQDFQNKLSSTEIRRRLAKKSGTAD